jgi:7-cyano-7-deazaguanine synthase
MGADMPTLPQTTDPLGSSLDGHTELAVLTSGGVDSAVLVAETLARGANVFPVYVRCGLRWETDELRHVHQWLAAPLTDGRRNGALAPLTVLELPVADLYGRHWSLDGRGVPDGASPDQAVFLPGRNVMLLVKTLLWCHLQHIPAVALGSLRGNPFPDATGGFLAAFEQAVNQAVTGRVRIVRPFAGLSKTDVLRRGRSLPLEWTFSCIDPVDGRHCGRCNKCAERRRAFADADVPDRTPYADAT